MNEVPNPLPSYFIRRKALESSLGELKSKAATEQIQLALFVTDVAVASTFDIKETLERIAFTTGEHLTSHTDRAEAAVEQLRTTIDLSNNERTGSSLNVSAFIASAARLQVETSTNAVNIEILKSDLLQSMGLMWLELLDTLYVTENRKIFFARIEKLFEYASSKLPVVGDILEALKTATEIYAIDKLQAKNADVYMLSLESYVDAVNIHLAGTLTFCERVDRLVAGDPAPTDEEVQQRILSHIEKVGSGTHATSRKRDA